jgi:ribulose 1,5-bisphosphate synthetase/thiazole synthase
MNSFWIDSFKNKTYPTLNEDLDVDVCIIGGGITGISCGYYLSKNNCLNQRFYLKHKKISRFV